MSQNHLDCFTRAGWFWDVVAISHPSSAEELCWEGCTAPRHSPPEAKPQNSWLWKLSLEQHLHHQKVIHLTYIRSSFCYASVKHLESWAGAVMLSEGFICLGLTASRGSKRQKVMGQHKQVAEEVWETRCLAEVWTSKLELTFSRGEVLLCCEGSWLLWGSWNCRHLHHSKICPKCFITTDNPFFLGILFYTSCCVRTYCY